MPRSPASAVTTPKLDKDGFVPLYFQIQQALLDKIKAGTLAEGDALASEEELARLYHVSRMTARQALQGLKNSGYIQSHKGRGTFVTRPKLEKTLLHLQGFSEDMKQRGMQPSSRVLDQTVLRASEKLATGLQIQPNDPILRLRRLRFADKIPMALEESCLPLKLFPGLDKLSFARQSLYAVLRDRFGARAAWADEIIEALPANREEAQLLTIPHKASILSISRTIMDAHNIPIESACSRYRGDRYRALIRVPSTSL